MTKLHKKQKKYNSYIPDVGVVKKERFKECKNCGIFVESTGKMLSYWDTHCLSCGGVL